ncbi:class I SAM-dependent methyltransferase [Acinetobacter qingfengensis]|uniref:SAM-dependent methyltransferase n=1 Tax=Acinetobacter qingfengensis TaxID=1262585 RepID=A0A1E7QZQ0_9GAMM|nr:class I SAM-dependent methyltransferase [Acinetobacter qingfengensis]KAA8731604.1 class I SAM-dependent methyltransferase [Acinetobacter qingfengensis]OEY92524.1 SAM-dependent methyltransferase [Acinetobacter qingfengensis]
MISQHDINQKQYANKSRSYLNSQVHSQGIEFEKVIKQVSTISDPVVLDLGCGGGHVSYHLAPFVKSVIAYDLSQEMLNTVEATAKTRKLVNIDIQQGCAEQLPFKDQIFDVVVTRYSAHHWQHVECALNEAWRVLKPNGIFILVDILGSDMPILDTFLQSIELIRDPSHVRNYSLSEWLRMLEYSNFQIKTIEKQRIILNFHAWVIRMQTTPTQIETIRFLQSQSADIVKNYFEIQEDGSFSSDVIFLIAEKF